jgi:hypothetical protein
MKRAILFLALAALVRRKWCDSEGMIEEGHDDVATARL